MPLEFIKPQLATSTDHPPPRAGWIHEVKHDGFRTLLIIERRKARAYTRNGFDWTDRYSGITKATARLDCRSAIIDGEVIVQDARGVSEFEALQSAIRWQPKRLILCVFDLLHLRVDECHQQVGTIPQSKSQRKLQPGSRCSCSLSAAARAKQSIMALRRAADSRSTIPSRTSSAP